MMAIHGALLDNDGTLTLSNDAHAHAWVDAFVEQGYDVRFETVRPLLGMGGDKLEPEVVPGLSSDDGVGKTIADRRLAIFLERYAPHLQPAPGARELVQHMKEDGLRLIVASSAKPDELDVLLTKARVDDLLPARTTSADAGETKPAPDIVAVALKKIGLQADQVLMLGDSPYDIAAAGKIGVGVIALRCGGFTDEQLKGAVAIYDDPADLLARYDASPLREVSRPAGAEVRGETTLDTEDGGV